MITLLIALSGSTAAVATKPPPDFAICSACHATQPRAPARIGPSLRGVVNRKAGAAPGFAYSPAMKKSDVTWNEKSLDAFISNPQKLIPGSKMPYGGEKDPARRAAIIRYLTSLH